jgi:hypothetical protein
MDQIDMAVQAWSVHREMALTALFNMRDIRTASRGAAEELMENVNYIRYRLQQLLDGQEPL